MEGLITNHGNDMLLFTFRSKEYSVFMFHVNRDWLCTLPEKKVSSKNMADHVSGNTLSLPLILFKHGNRKNLKLGDTTLQGFILQRGHIAMALLDVIEIILRGTYPCTPWLLRFLIRKLKTTS